MDSNLNTTTQALLISGSFIGKNEAVNGFLNVVCNLSTTANCLITCDQSVNGTTYEFSDTFLHDVSKFGTISRSQFYVKARYIRISVLNVSEEDIPKIVLTTLYTNQNQDISLEQPASITGDVFATDLISHQLLTDIHKITGDKGDQIDATIVLSNGILDEIKGALETSITAINDKVMKATYEGNSVNVACDENGVLKSNIVVENIALSPFNDGVTIFGSAGGGGSVIIATDIFGKLQTTDTDLNLKIETTNTTLGDIHTITGEKGDQIDASIVLSNGILDEIKVALETSITAINDKTLKATYEGNSINVACDENGVLKSNIVVENIALTPQTDGITIFGTSGGTDRIVIATDIFGKLQTTDTDLNLKIETTNTTLGDIHTITGEKGDQIDATIVLTNGILDNTLIAINDKVLKATFNDGTPRNVLCDANGVLKNANLTPQTDGVSLYGVFNNNMMALKTNMGGTLLVQDQSVLTSNEVGNDFLENIRDTIYTITNASLASILTQTTAVKDIITQTTNSILTDIKARLDLIENNTKKAYLTTITITNNTLTILNQNTTFQTFDLGNDNYRYTSITYAGTIYIGMNPNPPADDIPKVILEQSHDGTNWFSDGTQPSYHKMSAGNGGYQWQFILQKSNISLRYARLDINKITTFLGLNTTLSR